MQTCSHKTCVQDDKKMKSFLTTWFLNLKLDVTFEEALRVKPKVLDFRSHGLEKCPNLLEKLPLIYLSKLKCLALQSNQLVDFSRENCHCLDKLKGLTLDYNKLVELPFDIRHLQNLTSINVSHNNFESVRFFHIVCQLTNLRILWANATGLTEIPVNELKKLTKLHTLGLRRNRITVLSKELMALSSLKWLTLDDNLISEIPSNLRGIKSSLIHLNLRRNYLSEIPDSCRILLELQYLFLDYNLLKVDDHLKAFLRSFPSLKYCSLSGNLPNKTKSHRRTETGELITDNEDAATGNAVLPNAFSQESLEQSIRREYTEGEGHLYNEAIERIRLLENIENEWNGRRPHRDVNTTADNAEISNDSCSGEWGDVKILYCQSQDANQDEENDNIENEYDSTGGESSNLPDEEPASTAQVNTEELLSYLSDDGDDDDEDDDDVDDAEQSPQRDLASGDPSAAYSENDMEVPFESSSAISLLETEALPKEAIINPNTNWNSSVAIATTSHSSGHRMNRTEEWIQHLDTTTGENTFSPEKEEQREENDDESLQDVVDDLIEEAVNGNTPTTGVNDPPVSRSTSKVYIMPHGKESKPLCLNARSSFSTCNNNFSSSILTPLEQQDESIGTVTSHTNLVNVSSRTTSQVRQSQHGSRENIEISNSEAVGSTINQDDLDNQDEEDDTESDYDPSDWEHSAPSSAIDDQDIISRYTEFEDEGLGDDENLLMDILRIIPLAFVR